MNQDNFAISKEGLKLSYERFLSDSAGGYALALLFVLAYIADVPIPFRSTSWRGLVSGTVNTEVTILLGVLILLLGTPIGLLMNALSWFLFGSIQVSIVNLLSRYYKYLGPVTYSTIKAYDIDILKKVFRFESSHHRQNRPGLYEQASFFEEVLQLYFPSAWSSLSHVYGVKQFVRTLGLIFIIICIYSMLLAISTFLMGGAPSFLLLYCATAAVTLVIVIICPLLSGLIEFYLALGTLYKVYLLCRKEKNPDDLANIMNKGYEHFIDLFFISSQIDIKRLDERS